MPNDYLYEHLSDGNVAESKRLTTGVIAMNDFPKNFLSQLDNFAWIIIGVGIAVLCDWLKVPEAIWGAATGICLNKARSSNGVTKP